MSETGFTPPEAAKGEHKEKAINFSNSSSLESVLETLLSMKESGESLTGSHGKIDLVTLADAIAHAVDDIQRIGDTRAQYDQRKIDDALANRGVTRAGGLREALTRIMLRTRTGSIVTPRVYDLLSQINGTKEANEAAVTERVQAHLQADTEQQNIEQDIERWKNERKDPSFDSTELIIPAVEDQKQFETMQRWIKTKSQEDFLAGKALDPNLSMKDQLAKFMKYDFSVRDNWDRYDAATEGTLVSGEDQQTKEKIFARTFMVSIGMASKYDVLVSIVSGHEEDFPSIEDKNSIKGVVVEAINGITLNELATSSVQLENAHISKRTLLPLLDELATKIEHQFGMRIDLSKFVDEKLPDNKESYFPGEPDRPLRNSAGQLVNPGTNQPIQRNDERYKGFR